MRAPLPYYTVDLIKEMGRGLDVTSNENIADAIAIFAISAEEFSNDVYIAMVGDSASVV